MEFKVRRKAKSYTVTLATSVDDCQPVPMSDMASGVVLVGTMVTAAVALSIYAAVESAASFAKLYDAAGEQSVVTLAPSTAEARSYGLPAEVAGCHWIKIVSDHTATTAATATITLKS
jgi:hypothetical protein